jgi:hypothetical protein
LDLSRCGVSAAGVRALAGGLRRQAAAGPLRLVLGPGNDLGDESVVELAAALQERARSGDSQQDGDKGQQQQQQQQRGREAVNYDLDLGVADLGLAAVQALARLPGLKGLALFRAALSDAAVAALCGAVAASGGEGGGEGHAEERQFAGLRNLNLSGCGLGLASLKQLLAALERAGAGSPLRLVEVGHARARALRSPRARGRATGAHLAAMWAINLGHRWRRRPRCDCMHAAGFAAACRPGSHHPPYTFADSLGGRQPWR